MCRVLALLVFVTPRKRLLAFPLSYLLHHKTWCHFVVLYLPNFCQYASWVHFGAHLLPGDLPPTKTSATSNGRQNPRSSAVKCQRCRKETGANTLVGHAPPK